MRVNAQVHDFIRYGIEDGIAHSHIVDICQDKLGNIWFATQGGGLSKFNGLSFQNITVKDGLASNYIRKVVSDKNGNIWAATAEGLSVIRNGIIQNHLEIGPQEHLGESINSLFADSNNNIWMASSKNGITKISSSSEIKVYDGKNGFVDDRVIDITEDADGDIWIVTILNGLYHYRNGIFKHMIGVEDIKGYILAVDAIGDSLWLGTNNGTFSTIVNQDEELNLSEIDELGGVFVKSIINRDTEKWIISANGLLKVEKKKIIQFNESRGFTNETTLCGFKDREGNLWFGTNDGVFRYGNATFTKLSSSYLTDVRGIAKDKDQNIWFATFGNGIVKQADDAYYQITNNKGMSNSYVTAGVTDQNGAVWFGTRNEGVMKYSNSNWQLFTEKDGLINKNVRSIFCDKKGNVWLMTVNGLSKYNNGKFTNYSIENGLLDGVVWNFIEEDNRLLIVTRNGINEYKNEKLEVYDTNHNVFDKRINYITRDLEEDCFWIGYSGYGISRYNRTTGENHFISTEEGLISDIIHSLVVLDKNELLVATERGIDKVKLENDHKVKSIQHYGNTSNGLGLCDANPGKFYIDGNQILFGSKNGVFIYDQSIESSTTNEAIIYIDKFELAFGEDSVKNKLIKAGENIEIPYSDNSVSISYFGTHIANGNDVVYRYKLEGFRNDWSEITSSRQATFTNLPPNKYTFKVISRNSEGVWNETPASMEFRVFPPFYLTFWFFVLSIIAVVIATRYVYWLRVKMKVQKALAVEKIKEAEALRVRKMMARDFHDNMGNQLASITVFTNLISLKLKDSTEEIKGLLSNIEKHSKSLYTGTKDFIWSMDPESDNLLEIFTYLKDFGEDFFANTTMEFYSDADNLEGRNVIVPSGWSRQIVLIFKEAMTNALKYSKASKVELSINLIAKAFVIRFNDNGEGFDLATIKKGNGLTNMQQRSNKMGTQFRIDTNKNGGMSLNLTGSYSLIP